MSNNSANASICMPSLQGDGGLYCEFIITEAGMLSALTDSF